jgi:hypothetical protein
LTPDVTNGNKKCGINIDTEALFAEIRSGQYILREFREKYLFFN